MSVLVADRLTIACLWVCPVTPLLARPSSVSRAFMRLSNRWPTYRLTVNPECVTVFNDLKLGRGGPKYIIYKISDDQKEIVVDEVGKEADYDTFREKLISKKEKTGKDRPSYAIYDVEFELEGGEGKRCVARAAPLLSRVMGC